MAEGLCHIHLSAPAARSPLVSTLRVCAELGLELDDVEQASLGGQVLVSACVRADAATLDKLREQLEGAFAGEAVHLTLSTEGCAGQTRSSEDPRLVLTAFLESRCSRSAAALFAALEDEGVRPRALRQLARGAEGEGWRCVEAVLAPTTTTAPEDLRRRLLARLVDTPLDLALQPLSLLRRSKRLLVLDMDSTLIRIEVIDELARAHGVYEEVKAVTTAAMEGQLDFAESLRQRVAKLKGLSTEALAELANNLPLTPGAERMVRVLKQLGYRIGVVSGGFNFAASALKARLGLDFALANTLGSADGKLTGQVEGPIVTPERKAEVLAEVATTHGIHLHQTVAVGDGANDLLMLQRAGLGIAFHAKATLREAADTALSRGGLDRVLYILGLGDADIASLLTT